MLFLDLKEEKALLHLHNNLSKSNLSLFFLRLITKNNSFVVYEKFIKKGLKTLKIQFIF